MQEEGAQVQINTWEYSRKDPSALSNCKVKKLSRGLMLPRCIPSGASLMAQWVKNPPAMQETQKMWVQSLDQKDPLEKEMATHSSILAWEIPWTEEPGRLQSMELQRVGHN